MDDTHRLVRQRRVMLFCVFVLISSLDISACSQQSELTDQGDQDALTSYTPSRESRAGMSAEMSAGMSAGMNTLLGTGGEANVSATSHGSSDDEFTLNMTDLDAPPDLGSDDAEVPSSEQPDSALTDSGLSDMGLSDPELPDASIGGVGDSCMMSVDCEGDSYCYLERCLEPYMITPPSAPYSCESPSLAATPGRYTVTGDHASTIFASSACGRYELTDDQVERETERGYEVIFRVDLPPNSELSISSNVGYGDVDLPSTLSLFNACDPNSPPTQCKFSGLTGLSFGGGSVELSNTIRVSTVEATQVYAVVDLIHGATLRDLETRELQLQDLVFELSYRLF